MIALLLMLLAAGPTPGDLKTFGDWVVGCDNAKRCAAVSLTVDNGVGDATMRIEREPGPLGDWTVTLTPDAAKIGRVAVRLDGATLARGEIADAGLTITGASADAIVRRMVNGKQLTVERLVDGRVFTRVSLTGASATLRYIDAEQSRVGTVTAVVARGSRPASNVPSSRPLPVVVQVRAPRRPPEAIGPTLRRAIERETGCADEQGGPDLTPDPVRLDAKTTLVLIPCGAGAYNFSAVPVLVRGGKFSVAPFDVQVGFSPDATLLVNADWDTDRARLTEYSKGRGLGDCGTSSEYAWDGDRFRLVEQAAMSECRGSIDWITVWRAATIR